MTVALTCLACALALTPGADREPAPWVEVQAPRAGELVSLPVGLVEVRGQTGFGVRGSCDLVIALDLSESSLHPSGVDVDGDGRVGRTRARGILSRQQTPFEYWTTDFGDTVAQVELAFARSLIRRLDPSRTRVGLVTFSGEVEHHASVGSHGAALAALDRIEASLEDDWSGSNLAAALEAGVRALEEAPPTRGPRRRRAVVLISDGEPTVPEPDSRARRVARQAATLARDRSVAVHTVAVGEDASEKPGFLGQLAVLAGGLWTPAAHHGDLFQVLPHTGAGAIDSVEVRNATTGQPARALRLFEDGSFDGFIELVSGPNQIDILVNGDVVSSRMVRFERPEEVSRVQLREVQRLREALRERTLETELATRAGRRVLRRKVEMEAD